MGKNEINMKLLWEIIDIYQYDKPMKKNISVALNSVISA